MFPFNLIIKQKSLRPKSLTSNFFCLIFKVVCLLFPTHTSRTPNSFFPEKQLAIFWASFQALLRLCLVSYQAFLPTALFRLCLVSYQALAYSLAQALPGVEPSIFACSLVQALEFKYLLGLLFSFLFSFSFLLLLLFYRLLLLLLTTIMVSTALFRLYWVCLLSFYWLWLSLCL